MVLVFILCAIVILITLLITMLILSTLRIELRHFEAGNIKNYQKSSNSSKEKNREQENSVLGYNPLSEAKIGEDISSQISKDYQFKISLVLFDKLKWIGIRLDNRKIEKMSRKIKWKDIDLKKVEQDFNVEDIKQLKNLQPKLTYLNLETKIGIEDAVITSFLVGIIGAIISIMLPHVVKKYEENQYHYKIVPLYWNKNIYEIKFDCIIEMKMVHIINILYFLGSKKVRKQFA